MRVQLNFVFIQVHEKFVSTKHLAYFYQLVIIIVSMKERLLPEDHGRKHATETPHVQRVVVFLEVNEQLWALEVPRGHTNIVLCVRMIEFSKTPVNQS